MAKSSIPPAAADKRPAVSYYTKQPALCPFCQTSFAHEEMLSGSGRMIAGDLTDDLHRLYEPSAKYGKIYPTMYAVGACPKCHAALLWNDFPLINDNVSIESVNACEQERKKAVSLIFPHYRLEGERRLFDGAAMYYLALHCYEKLSPSHAPTIHQAVISLRLAWLCAEIEKACPGRNYAYVSEVFYRKALFFYDQALEKERLRQENIGDMANLGPDVDKNYGYDGVIYLRSLLEYKYGQGKDMSRRIHKLDECKRSIARIFGLGKSSRAKPGPLLEHSRLLYETLSRELKDSQIIEIGED